MLFASSMGYAQAKKMDVPEWIKPAGDKILWDALIDLGVTRATTAGMTGLDYQEIESYGRAVGIDFRNGAVMIRKLSAAFARGYNAGMDKDGRPPWLSDQQFVDNQIFDWLDSIDG